MSLPRTLLLLAVALGLGAGALLLLRMRHAPEVPPLERPHTPEDPRNPPPHVKLEDAAPPKPAVDLAPAPPPAPDDTAELRALGVQRGWQLPVGKAWWSDTLINPGGREPAAGEIASLQAEERRWIDQLTLLRVRRQQRRDAYAQECVAAGKAVEDPQGVQPPAEGKEPVIVKTQTTGNPVTIWRVDVAPGDDAELDKLDRQLTDAWCQAVRDLRKRFATPPR